MLLLLWRKKKEERTCPLDHFDPLFIHSHVFILAYDVCKLVCVARGKKKITFARGEQKKIYLEHYDGEEKFSHLKKFKTFHGD